MFIFDLSNPLTLLLVVLATALLIFLGQEIKRSSVAVVPLISFLPIMSYPVCESCSVLNKLTLYKSKKVC